MIDLIPRERRIVAPGAVHLPDWLDLGQQRLLVTACRQWASEGPGIRAAATSAGRRWSMLTSTSIGLSAGRINITLRASGMT